MTPRQSKNQEAPIRARIQRDYPSRPVKLVTWSPIANCGLIRQFRSALGDEVLQNWTVERLSVSTPPAAKAGADMMVVAIPPHAVAAGIKALRDCHQRSPTLPLFVVTDCQNEDEFAQMAKAGPTDFFRPPLHKERILGRLQSALKRDGGNQEARDQALKGLIGQNKVFRLQIESLKNFAGYDLTVLISGETGTGKEVFAEALHYLSPRCSHRFVPVNCAALPEGLVENELFGHEGGAFTGADGWHSGLIHQTEGGTLFLDEVDSLPLPIQAKLLRFLQGRKYSPLGAGQSREPPVKNWGRVLSFGQYPDIPDK